MTSERVAPTECFVWIWLPEAETPVVAGRLARSGNSYLFNYGQSYLARKDAISLYEPELPLRSGVLPLLTGLTMPNCIRDAAPDAWGRRIIIARVLGQNGADADPAQIDELTYLLESGSDRVGALDFQSSPTKYVPRERPAATLDELLNAAERVEKGIPLTPELEQALLHGSSIGGARPKAMITDGEKKYIAKFSAQNDTYSVVKAEFAAMRLASLAGLSVASVKLHRAADKDVLLIQRFDRVLRGKYWLRRDLVSALTLLGLDEMMARYASYEELATIIRHRFADPQNTLHELFGRIVFNVLCGNNDDHARNHAAFWNGRTLRITPAYDICPQMRTGNETGQAMTIIGDNRQSRIAVCLEAAPVFQLSAAAATDIVAKQIRTIVENWQATCVEAELTDVDRQFLWRRQFLNPYAFQGAPEGLATVVA